MKLLPGYYNLGEAKPLTANPTAYLRNGFAHTVVSRYAAGAATAEAGKPYALTIGQVLYHSGKLSTRASGLVQLSPSKGRLQMNQADLARLEIGANDAVRVSSARSAVELRTEANPDLAPGTCFFPEHYNEPPIKDLAECVTDPTTGVPAFKFVRVSIEKV
jgi:formate dehydrogenase alpha subunit